MIFNSQKNNAAAIFSSSSSIQHSSHCARNQACECGGWSLKLKWALSRIPLSLSHLAMNSLQWKKTAALMSNLFKSDELREQKETRSRNQPLYTARTVVVEVWQRATEISQNSKSFFLSILRETNCVKVRKFFCYVFLLCCVILSDSFFASLSPFHPSILISSAYGVGVDGNLRPRQWNGRWGGGVASGIKLF